MPSPSPERLPNASTSQTSSGVLSRSPRNDVSSPLHSSQMDHLFLFAPYKDSIVSRFNKLIRDHSKFRKKKLSSSQNKNKEKMVVDSKPLTPQQRESIFLKAVKDTYASKIQEMKPNISIPSLSTILSHDTSSTPSDHYDASFEKLRGNVVMLGGYRGSILENIETGEVLWATFKSALSLSTPDLKIGLSSTDEEEIEARVRATKMLGSLAGGMVDLGDRLFKKLQRLEKKKRGEDKNLKVHSFGYDWRVSLALSSKKLQNFLVSLRESSPSKEGATIICHSLGGLVTLHALATAIDPTIFKAIVFLGTPFGACPSILGPFRHGDSVFKNEKICTPAAVFSMRSSFYLLPSPYTKVKTPAYETFDGEGIEINFLDERNWSELGLSPLTVDLLEEPSETHRRVRDRGWELGQRAWMGVPEILNDSECLYSPAKAPYSPDPTRPSDDLILTYLRRVLSEVNTFHRVLSTSFSPDKIHLYPPAVLVTGNSVPTIQAALVSSKDGIRTSKYESLKYVAGDGVVSEESSRQSAMPGGWGNIIRGEEWSKKGHLGLMGDFKVVGKCLDRLFDERGEIKPEHDP